jgi:hypothetical protein
VPSAKTAESATSAQSALRDWAAMPRNGTGVTPSEGVAQRTLAGCAKGHALVASTSIWSKPIASIPLRRWPGRAGDAAGENATRNLVRHDVGPPPAPTS